MEITTNMPGACADKFQAIAAGPNNDHEAVMAVQDGDYSAFKYIMTKYQQRVFFHCLRMVGDREESADLTQEVFLKVLKNIQKYKHTYAFYTWLYRITVNCCIDYMRKLKCKINEVSLSRMDNSDYSDLQIDSDIPDDRFSPELELINKELRGILNTAIEKLPEILRCTIILKDIEGYSYADIALIFDCSIGTVKSRMHRARGDLKSCLATQL